MMSLILFMLAQAANPKSDQNSGTGTPATQLPPEQMFRVGSDTLADIVGKIGKPVTVVHNSDGTTIAIFSSNHTKVKGATFVPIVGLFAGGAKAQISTKSFTFGSDGLLKSYSASDTNLDCSSSIGGARCK